MAHCHHEFDEYGGDLYHVIALDKARPTADGREK